MLQGNSIRRCRAISRLGRAITACTVIIGLAGLLSAGAAASGVSHELVYRVTHSVFGEIGTYSNTVEPVADGTLVMTRVDFNVRMLGVRMYHQDAERTERWQGGRLVLFDGITNKGSGPVEVKGQARGNHFVITSPQGTVDAPAGVHPANPWSANFLNTRTMMRPDSGRVERVQISGGQPTQVAVGGATIPARKYQVDGNIRYTVWIDGRGVPVKFIADDNTGEVTFTLAKCVHCGLDGARLGQR